MAETEPSHETDAKTLSLSDAELSQLMAPVGQVSANQLRGILVSRFSLKQIFAIVSGILGSLGLVLGAGYCLGSFVAELKDTGTQYKVEAKESQLQALQAKLDGKDTEAKAIKERYESRIEKLSSEIVQANKEVAQLPEIRKSLDQACEDTDKLKCVVSFLVAREGFNNVAERRRTSDPPLETDITTARTDLQRAVDELLRRKTALASKTADGKQRLFRF